MIEFAITHTFWRVNYRFRRCCKTVFCAAICLIWTMHRASFSYFCFDVAKRQRGGADGVAALFCFLAHYIYFLCPRERSHSKTDVAGHRQRLPFLSDGYLAKVVSYRDNGEFFLAALPLRTGKKRAVEMPIGYSFSSSIATNVFLVYSNPARESRRPLAARAARALSMAHTTTCRANELVAEQRPFLLSLSLSLSAANPPTQLPPSSCSFNDCPTPPGSSSTGAEEVCLRGPPPPCTSNKKTIVHTAACFWWWWWWCCCCCCHCCCHCPIALPCKQASRESE